jgi:hypothetical protein
VGASWITSLIFNFKQYAGQQVVCSHLLSFIPAYGQIGILGCGTVGAKKRLGGSILSFCHFLQPAMGKNMVTKSHFIG